MLPAVWVQNQALDDMLGEKGLELDAVVELQVDDAALTDRLAVEQRDAMRARGAVWFAGALSVPVRLDRLVLFHEAEPGATFRRLDDFVLKGSGR